VEEKEGGGFERCICMRRRGEDEERRGERNEGLTMRGTRRRQREGKGTHKSTD